MIVPRREVRTRRTPHEGGSPVPVPGCAAELQRVPLFERVDPALLAGLEQAAFVRRVSRGQILFVEGEPTDHLYVLRKGVLKVHLTSEQGAELLLSILSPGYALGEVSLVDDGPRSAGVTALTDAELLAVPSAAVRELLHDHHEALWAVAMSLAAGMRRLTQQTADLVFLDLPRRLAKLLLDSAVPDAAAVPVAHLPVTQGDLAAMLGVTRQSLNRALSGLVTRGWVQQADNALRLTDVPALTRFVRT